ncbi:hypothetical protein COCON_G00130680 [Conger conger]|uniref:Cadherin domain-containing protein n=1 Tax=Conger conger TaxID=82655 RepID=A0A9Q1HX45_CONCO|nr:hypothetical protein COCON_G00130680 [Conger conger]
MTLYLPAVIFFFLTVFVQSAEPCLPQSIQASVPRDVMVGYVISRVNLAQCSATRLMLTSDDPQFSIQRDGTIVAHQLLRVPVEGRTFSVWFKDQNGLRRKMDICLSQRAHQIGLKEQGSGPHRRFKRRWSPMPFLIPENDIPSFPKQLDLIGSDTSENYTLYYVISGPGVTEEPKGVFSVDRNSGMLSVHKPVDREKNPIFRIKARAINVLTNKDTDEPLIITVNVLDKNDNAPQFSGLLKFSVPEKSPPGTTVGTVSATDIDEPNTLHTKIRYTLLSGNNLFVINPDTGLITTKTATLDREVKDIHFVTVEIRDMNGAANGYFNTGTATISLKDINDNAPTFSQKIYNAKVQENEDSGLILRIPVTDKDLPKTPNWNAVFKIIQGNENGNFRIETDPATNEGLLYIAKPLDYEKNKNPKLEVVAENETPLVGTTETWSSALVDVSVVDVDEGPEFIPPELVKWVKENTPNGTIIGTYTATDPETSSSAGMRYLKLTDPASWLKVDEKTGDLTIINTVDRESKFVQNGMYNVTVKATDASSKSGTGTVIIKVEDENDNVPLPLARELELCQKKGELGSVMVVADDKDQIPFSAPFTFHLADGHDEKWTVVKVNDTAALLQQAKELPTGNYDVPLEIKDQQSLGDQQTVTVRVCQCRSGRCPAPLKSISLGVWGILALLLGLALLLLLALCCAMKCVKSSGKFHVVDGADSGGMLLKSNTEAPGDAVTSDIMVVPASAMDQSMKGSQGSHIGIANTSGFGTATGFGTGTGAGYGVGTGTDVLYGPQYNYIYQEGVMADKRDTLSRGVYGAGGSSSHLVDGQAMKFMDPSALTTWNTNAMFLAQKLEYFRTAEDGRYSDDLLHSYGFEGQGSPAGSVGCCSEQGHEEGLEFLNTLGPKFKNLAEVCSKK